MPSTGWPSRSTKSTRMRKKAGACSSRVPRIMWTPKMTAHRSRRRASSHGLPARGSISCASRRAATLRLSGAAQPNPTQNRQRASNDAQRGKPHDEPDKLRRVRNAENPAPEGDCCKPDESEPNGAGAEDIGKQSHLRVLECARGGDDRGEWKRRRRQAGKDKRAGRTLAHLLLQVVDASGAHHLLEAFLAPFATDQIQQQNSGCRPQRCGQEVEGARHEVGSG